MSFTRLRRSVFATLLGLIALVGNGIALTQLNGNVVWASLHAAAPSGHHMDMAQGEMAHSGHNMGQSAHGDTHPCHETATAAPQAHDTKSNSGHTNRGHADCAMCGPVGALAALTLTSAPPSIGLLAPSQAHTVGVPATQTTKHQPLSYRSRAPPVLS